MSSTDGIVEASGDLDAAGYLAPAQKELSQAFDKRRYPDLVLNPERLAMLRSTGAGEALIHGLKGGQTEEVQKVESIEDVAEGDRLVKEIHGGWLRWRRN